MFNGCGKCSMTLFLFSSNSVETLCVSWALPFNKRVRVWACKIRKPHTHVFVPTSHKVFLRNYWKLNRLSSNNCHRPLNTKNNIQSLHQPPHFSIRFKLFSQHLQIGNCSFIMRDFEHRRCVEGVVCPHAPLRVFT